MTRCITRAHPSPEQIHSLLEHAAAAADQAERLPRCPARDRLMKAMTAALDQLVLWMTPPPPAAPA